MAEESQPSEETIALRAWEISQSDQGRSDEENWQRAEQELRGDTAGPWAKTSSGDASSVSA